MRVTDTSFYQRFLSGLQSTRQDMSDALDAITDQKRVRVASDDPVGAHQALGLRGKIVRLEGFVRSASSTRFDLSTIDTVLGEAIELVSKARTEGMAGASDPSQEVNDIRADTVESLRERLLRLANTSQNGRYLFAGTETLTQPFDDSGVYAGNDDEVQAPIDDGQEVGGTLSGRAVFQGAAGDLLQALDDLAVALRDGDTPTAEARIAELGDHLNHLSDARAKVGFRMTRIDGVVVRHEDDLVRVRTRVSQIEDAPLEEAAVRLSAATTQFEALSGTAARVLGRSLFDFLG